MGSYISDMRRFVGHAPLLQCAASIIIEDDAGRILLGKRTDNKCWGYAGGSIELGETVEECARRELFEETGLTAGDIDLFMINSGEPTHYTYPNGDEVYNVEIVYICSDYTGKLHPQEDEISELKFFDKADIPDEISPPIRPVIEKYLERRKNK